MANSRSALKRVRQTKVRTARNRNLKSRLKDAARSLSLLSRLETRLLPRLPTTLSPQPLTRLLKAVRCTKTLPAASKDASLLRWPVFPEVTQPKTFNGSSCPVRSMT